MLHNIFEEIEDWQCQYYQFDQDLSRLHDYATAYKQVVTNYLSLRLYNIYAIGRFREEMKQKEFSVIGVSPDIADAVGAFCGKEIKNNIRPFKVPNLILNFAVTISIVIFSWLWISSRIRLFLGPAKTYSFMADYIGDMDDMNLYPDMTDDGNMRLVARSKRNMAEYLPDQISQIDYGPVTEGVLDAAQGLLSIGHVFRNSLRLLVFAGRFETALYFKLISMPFKRMVYRALFRRFRPKVFWGRDAYNVEHILRRPELNAVGGQSWCTFHGYPIYSCIYPMFRYISLDRLFTVSRSFYKKYYAANWNSDIVVKDTSTFRASREVFSMRAPAETKPPDVLILCSIFIREPIMTDFVRTIAIAFPNRKIYLQVKPGFRKLESGRFFVKECTDGIPNIVVSEARPYDLFAKARYVFSDPSTAIMEALQFGSMSFSIDFPSVQRVSPLREFKEICISSGDMAVERINLIENGLDDYPIDSVKSLANLSGICFQDAIRTELGLMPREPARPVW